MALAPGSGYLLMYWFLIPLLLGFTFNAASTLTTLFSRHLGERNGKLASMLLRDVLGIPVWAIGYVVAVDTNATMLFNPSTIPSRLGWLFIVAGAVVILIGLLAIRGRAAAPSVHDTLVAHGIYAYIRHPLHSGTLLEFIGLSLWVPKPTVLIACGLGVIWVLVQTILEEKDLLQRLPAYKDYMRRVPRFIPRFALRNKPV